MLSGILLFNQKGELLILRAFRQDMRPRLADVFRIQVISNAQIRSPILTLGSTTFSHIKSDNIYVVGVSKGNVNSALVFEFLYKLVSLGKSDFGRFDEEAVKSNFVMVYELLDEVLDFGYPQNTETETLKMYITTEGAVKSEQRALEDSSKITMQATGALSWRRDNIKYRKNEAFVDVIEDVNLLVSATGTVLRADVNGSIEMRAYLTGTPECKFGLNDRLTLGENGADTSLGGAVGNIGGNKASKAAAGSVTLEDVSLHQCVKLSNFTNDRTISFIPPDGSFQLMTYRATENVNLPFKVQAIVNEVGKSKVDFSIAIRANYGSKLFATNVVVKIPTPLNTANTTHRTSQGKAKYEPSENAIVWKIARFTGQSEFVLSAEAELSAMTQHKAWSRPPLSMQFSLLMFTSSGLLVRYLKVFEKSNYSSVKWVRYMTRAGSYEIRLGWDTGDHSSLTRLTQERAPAQGYLHRATSLIDITLSSLPNRGSTFLIALPQTSKLSSGPPRTMSELRDTASSMQLTLEPQVPPDTELMAVDSDVHTQVGVQKQEGLESTGNEGDEGDEGERGGRRILEMLVKDEVVANDLSMLMDPSAGSYLHAQESSPVDPSPAECTPSRTECRVQMESVLEVHRPSIQEVAADIEATDRTLVHDMNTDVAATGRSLAQDMDAENAAIKAKKQPTLLQKALAAMTKKKAPKQLTHGDILLVLDVHDLRKTLRIDSKALRHQLPIDSRLIRLIEAAGGTQNTPISGVRVLAVLEHSAVANVPTLHIQALDVSAPAVASVTPSASPTTDDIEMKLEEGSGDDGDVVRTPAVPLEHVIDWAKAHDSLIRIIIFLPNISAQKCGLPLDAETALLPLESIVALASHYSCLQVVRSAFMSIASTWISGRSLYPAIANHPHDWLALAVELQSQLVYNEAFVHMVGLYPNGKLSGIPDELRSLIAAESLALHYKRQEIDQQLLMTTLGTTSRQRQGDAGNLTAGDTRIKPVSQHSYPILWTLVNLWRDYIAEHLAHLKAGSWEHAEATPTCEHGDNNTNDAAIPECLTVAGFYRTLHSGGDGYMALEDVIA
ncbi:clathrin associated protein complex medium subunit [Friedmanniomyces endolithicus]|nr:clathrin associated protein complex medium subunit [Friedmanniomyces endolithicus]